MNDVINKLTSRDNRSIDDYTDENTGLIMCGVCHHPKQANKEIPSGSGNVITVPITCICEQQREKEAAEREKKSRFSSWMDELQARYSIAGADYSRFTFDADDRTDEKTSAACHRYVDKWERVTRDNIGILFYGSVGTGKSFYACAIVNALKDRCIPAVVTSFPRLLNLLQTCPDRQGLIDALRNYKLLVIDDLGVERDSPYAAEQVFNVIDARVNSGLPLIVTTNLTLDELKSPASMQYARIYDRVLEMCPARIKMAGESRRVKNTAIWRAMAREILTGDV
jgi:DNA replication protein DnaC